MINIFDTLTSYKTKWQVTNSRSFNAAEIATCPFGTVVNSDYGFSVEFVRSNGTVHYIPVAQDNLCGVGDIVDLSKATLLTLSKPGEKDIIRIDF